MVSPSLPEKDMTTLTSLPKSTARISHTGHNVVRRTSCSYFVTKRHHLARQRKRIVGPSLDLVSTFLFH